MDYDISIFYHLGKTNIVVDALSQKVGTMGSLACILFSQRLLAWDISSLANKTAPLDIFDSQRILSSVKRGLHYLSRFGVINLRI